MLADGQIREAKAADKPYMLTDGGGLHVYVTSAGGELWRLRYEFERKAARSFGEAEGAVVRAGIRGDRASALRAAQRHDLLTSLGHSSDPD